MGVDSFNAVSKQLSGDADGASRATIKRHAPSSNPRSERRVRSDRYCAERHWLTMTLQTAITACNTTAGHKSTPVIPEKPAIARTAATPKL